MNSDICAWRHKSPNKNAIVGLDAARQRHYLKRFFSVNSCIVQLFQNHPKLTEENARISRTCWIVSKVK